MNRWTRPIFRPTACAVCSAPATVELAATPGEPTELDWSARCDGHTPSADDPLWAWLNPADLALDTAIRKISKKTTKRVDGNP